MTDKTDKKLCVNCRYFRPEGVLDAHIPGTGNFCSNSKSSRVSTRVKKYDTCSQFVNGDGESIPLGLRFRSIGVQLGNEIVKSIAEAMRKGNDGY